ncbi:hypothetical protein FRC03_000164 [Tulasnella sp. 419]|nr:hypothetical protein FRC03_000164 [Tulasnella sp. 419]
MSHREPEYPNATKLPMDYSSHRRSPPHHYTTGDQHQGFSYQRWPEHPSQYTSLSSHASQQLPSAIQNDNEYTNFTSTRSQSRSDAPLSSTYARWEVATPSFPPTSSSQYGNESITSSHVKAENNDTPLRASHPNSPETSQPTGYYPNQSPSATSHMHSYEYHNQYYTSYTTPNFPSPPPSSSTSSSRPSPPDERSLPGPSYPINSSPSSSVKQQHHSLPSYYGTHSVPPQSRGRSWTTSTAAELNQTFGSHHSGSHNGYPSSTSTNYEDGWSSTNMEQQHIRHRSYPLASPSFPPQGREESRRSGPISIPQNPPSSYNYSHDVPNSFSGLESPPSTASGPIDDMSSTSPPVKPKRKRADATQLRVLNEVYARTAFPSTEERAELAKRLGMSPRQVQIWFQNRRQNARQSRANSNAAQYPPVGDAPSTRNNASPERQASVLYGSYGSTTGEQDPLPYPNYPPLPCPPSEDHSQMGPPSYQKGQ